MHIKLRSNGLQSPMNPHIANRIIIGMCMVVASLTVEFILRPGVPTCTILVSSFDPFKVELKVPSIASKVEGQHVALTLTNLKTEDVIKQQKIPDGRLFRQNFYLEPNDLYQMCFEFITKRTLKEDNFLLMGFKAQENFQSMLDDVKVPAELVGKEKLVNIYETGLRMNEFLQMSSDRQKKERQVEDRIVGLSSHKTKRIVSITIIECTVIVLSGIYQLFALRSFLIDKRLY